MKKLAVIALFTFISSISEAKEINLDKSKSIKFDVEFVKGNCTLTINHPNGTTTVVDLGNATSPQDCVNKAKAYIAENY